MRKRWILFATTVALAACLLAGGCGDPPSPSTNGTPPAGGVRDVTPPSTVFVVSPTCRDHLLPAPCDVLGSGGLFSLGTIHEQTVRRMPVAIGLFMGDLSMARGNLGRQTVLAYYDAVVPQAGVKFVCVGVGELQHGAAWVRDTLRRMHGPTGIAFLCANATDPEGSPVLAGSDVAQASPEGEVTARNTLVVGVMAPSLQDELLARGSDVRLTEPGAAAARAVEQGLATAAERGIEVHTRVLLVQGTLDEATAIVEQVPGFDFAVAGRGTTLPARTPRKVGPVPVYYAGQGLRFVWRVSVDGTGPDGIGHSLVRLGSKLVSLGSRYGPSMQHLTQVMANGVLDLAFENPAERPTHPDGTFVGAAACKECHPRVYEQHRASAHGRLSKTLREEPVTASTACMPCHVTQPFFRGGWTRRSPFEDFFGVSCESCHGPGSEHVQAPAKGWGAVGLQSCTRCHLPDRSPGFDARRLWRDLGHGTEK